MRKILIAIGLFILLAIAALVFSLAQKPKTAGIKVGDAEFRVEIADTPASRAQGLSGRDNLAGDQAMLFVFPAPGTYGFWMKDMKFPLDIIWIGGGKVIGVEHDTQPEAGPNYTVYYPPVPVDKVLEINAGLAKKIGIQVGSVVQ